MERAVKDPSKVVKGLAVMAQIVRYWNRGCAISVRELSDLTTEYSNFHISGTAFSEIQRQKRPNPGPALFAAIGDINAAAARIQAEMTPNGLASRPIERLKVVTVNGEVANAGDFLLFFLGESEPDNDLTPFSWTESLMAEAVRLLRAEIVKRCIALRRDQFTEIETLAAMAAELEIINLSDKTLFAGWLAGFGEKPSHETAQGWLEAFSPLWERWTGSHLDPRSLVGQAAETT